MSKLILVLGGTRSGKSDFAQKLASKSETVTYIATAKATDEEMKKRIDNHEKNRPKDWQTIEMDSQSLNKALQKCRHQTVIIDCLGNLIANGDSPYYQFENRDCPHLISEIAKSLEDKKNLFKQLIIVSNEVGLSLVSPHKSGRDFSDAIGLLNQNIASVADEVFLIVAGVPMKIK